MFTAITVLIIIVCILLVLVVLAQNSKGGGLASGFAGGNQVMGVKKTTDFIEKLTWGLAVSLIVLCMVASLALPNKEDRGSGTSLQNKIDEAPTAPQQKAPMQTPAAQPAQQNPEPAK
jgi:preprotein translocase subunit SecG